MTQCKELRERRVTRQPPGQEARGGRQAWQWGCFAGHGSALTTLSPLHGPG